MNESAAVTGQYGLVWAEETPTTGTYQPSTKKRNDCSFTERTVVIVITNGQSKANKVSGWVACSMLSQIQVMEGKTISPEYVVKGRKMRLMKETVKRTELKIERPREKALALALTVQDSHDSLPSCMVRLKTHAFSDIHVFINQRVSSRDQLKRPSWLD
uniref:Uncharacterized protein n=1 Tax=Nelumbo nucifera TaxID=4432 RepID=A0A822YLU3_NELNU|nr:TPA_asm: hypothetical protein HUJ06_010826 [Nelumbo nucifera]